jgi:Ca2+-binding RTX toxin-like protein
MSVILPPDVTAIYGTINNDYLVGTSGLDVIFGYGGHDRLLGRSAKDELRGGSGHDRLFGESGNDALYGELGNDTLDGGDGDDHLDGGDGDDLMTGGAGTDTFYGGAGDDGVDYTYHVGGNRINLDTGRAESVSGPTVERLFSIERVYTGAGRDIVTGNAADNYVQTNGGVDFVYGGDGDDTIYGGDGSDTLRGDRGDDRVYGGGGNDTLRSGPGNDLLTGGSGADRFEIVLADHDDTHSIADLASIDRIRIFNLDDPDMDASAFDTNGSNHVDADDENSEIVGGNLVLHTSSDGRIVLFGISSFSTDQLLF